MPRGKQIILDAVSPRDLWPDDNILEQLMVQAAITGGATPLDFRLIRLPCAKSRIGSPPGGTAWLGLDESHCVMHWYDRDQTVEFALDIFTCGKSADPIKIMNIMKVALGAIGSERVLDRFDHEC